MDRACRGGDAMLAEITIGAVCLRLRSRGVD